MFVVGALAVAFSAAPVMAGSGGGSSKVQTTELHVELTSQGTTLHQVGSEGEHTYGWNHLTGTASSDSGDIAVDMQGAVDHGDGAGTRQPRRGRLHHQDPRHRDRLAIRS